MTNLNKLYVNNKEIYKYDHIKMGRLNKSLDREYNFRQLSLDHVS